MENDRKIQVHLHFAKCVKFNRIAKIFAIMISRANPPIAKIFGHRDLGLDESIKYYLENSDKKIGEHNVLFISCIKVGDDLRSASHHDFARIKRILSGYSYFGFEVSEESDILDKINRISNMQTKGDLIIIIEAHGNENSIAVSQKPDILLNNVNQETFKNGAGIQEIWTVNYKDIIDGIQNPNQLSTTLILIACHSGGALKSEISNSIVVITSSSCNEFTYFNENGCCFMQQWETNVKNNPHKSPLQLIPNETNNGNVPKDGNPISHTKKKGPIKESKMCMLL